MIEIPPHFFKVQYCPQQYPGVAKGLKLGANCQHFCYELLRHFGYEIGCFRSSELWCDQVFTDVVDNPQALDLVLFNSSPDSYGAHVGIFVDNHKILHLSKRVGHPVIWELNNFLEVEDYKVVIGYKRPKVRSGIVASDRIGF